MENNNEITAEWARKLAQSVLGDKVKQQIATCLDAVVRAVKINKLSVDVGIYVEPLTRRDLEGRGFKVEVHKAMDQRESDYITISW